MNLNKEENTWGEYEGLFWWKDDVLYWAVMVVVMVSCTPMSVVFVVREYVNASFIVSCH